MRQRSLALARHEEAKHQGTRTVTRTVPREHWHKGSCQRGVRTIFKNQSPAGLFWCWLCVLWVFCLFGFFSPETGLDILSQFSFWQTDDSHRTLHFSYMTLPKDPPIPLENLSNILDKAGEVGCIRVSILKW